MQVIRCQGSMPSADVCVWCMHLAKRRRIYGIYRVEHLMLIMTSED